MPLHKRETLRDQLIDSVYADQGLKASLPATHCPERRDAARRRHAGDLRRAPARRQRAPEPGDVLPDVGGAGGPSADGPLHRQEPHRQGRVSPDGRAGAALCPHAGRPVERCPRRRSRSAARPSGRRRAACSAAWRPSGAGGPSGEAAGKPTDKPNMVCGPVQVVWHKFARYWDIEMREIPMAPGRYQMDVEQMLEQVDENTIMVVPTFGVTYTGSYEPVLELSQALDKLQEETGLDIDIHVDGASGAFLAPFCAPDILWDFRVPRVKSISSSGHKFGSGPARRGLGAVAGHGGPAGRPDLPRHLPRGRHAGVPDQLLPPGRPGRGAVLQLRAARPGRLPQRPRRLLQHGQVPGRRGGQAGAVRAALRLGSPEGDPLGGLAHQGRRGSRATRSTTSPTACGRAAGRCRPTR